jgi:hypothetical protein
MVTSSDTPAPDNARRIVSADGAGFGIDRTYVQPPIHYAEAGCIPQTPSPLTVLQVPVVQIIIYVQG